MSSARTASTDPSSWILHVAAIMTSRPSATRQDSSVSVKDPSAAFSAIAARGPASGWALTDWISEIVLNHCGPELYDRWVARYMKPWTEALVSLQHELETESHEDSA